MSVRLWGCCEAGGISGVIGVRDMRGGRSASCIFSISFEFVGGKG